MRQAKRFDYILQVRDFKKSIDEYIEKNNAAEKMCFGTEYLENISHYLGYMDTVLEMLENECVDPKLDYYALKPELLNLKGENDKLKSIVMPIGAFFSDHATNVPCQKEIRKARDYYLEQN